MSKMTDDRQEKSRTMRTEVKEVIKKMLLSGQKLTIANISRKAKCSRSFLYTPEMKKFIEEQRENQRNEERRVDIELQNSVFHTKLMAAYIFLYSLLDQQEEFYKIAIEDLKNKDKSFNDTAIMVLARILEQETKPERVIEILEAFLDSFEKNIPDWKEKLIKTLNSCVALDMLKNT